MNGNRETILIVNDIPEDIITLEEILKKEYQVIAVTNGDAALKIAQSEEPPDLIMLNTILPQMDGFEVCRRLRQNAAGTKIPVIFLTAKVMTADEKSGLDLGAVDFIKKPVDPEIVRTHVSLQLEQKDNALRSSEVRFRRLFETSRDGIMLFDTGTGIVVDANQSMAAMLGLTQEDFLGKRISDLEFLKSVIAPTSCFPESRQHEYIRNTDQPIQTANGRMIYVEYVYHSYMVNNREVTQLNVRDITNLVAAEEERDGLSARLAHYLSTSPTVTYSLILKNGETRWQWASENIQSLLGYSSQEVLEEDWWLKNSNADDQAEVLKCIVELTKTENDVREYRFTRKDQNEVWIRDEMHLVHGLSHESEIVGTLTDITARKKAEEEINLRSEALEAAANAVIITDANGIIKWANRAFENLSGYSKDEAIGKNPRDLVKSGKESPETYSKLWSTILSGNVWNGELVDKKKSGELYREELTITPMRDITSNITNFIAIKRDIAGYKKNPEATAAHTPQ